MLSSEIDSETAGADESALPVRWDGLMRSGTNARREDREKSFYPIFVDEELGTVQSVGEYVPLGQEWKGTSALRGTAAHWPIRSDGSEGRWQLSPTRLRQAFAAGTARVGSRTNEFGMLSFSYLKDGQLSKIQSGEIEVLGKDERGVLQLAHADEVERVEVPRTVWNRQSHSAADHRLLLAVDRQSQRQNRQPALLRSSSF